jgi:hypothetical protein
LVPAISKEFVVFPHPRLALVPAVFIIVVGLACNLTPTPVEPSAEATIVANALAGTVAAGQTSTAAVMAAAGTLAAGDAAPMTSVTPPPVAPTTGPPTATLTPSATLPPIASLTQNTNCRGGPLAVYDLIRTFLIGESARITGKNAGGDYWYVTDPNQPGKDCWLWGRYAQVSGDTASLPVFTPPPTPTPAYDWSGDWSVLVDGDPASMSLDQSGSSVTGTLTDTVTSYGVSGTAGDGGRTLSGSVSPIAPPVTFDFRMTVDMHQFQGHYTREGIDYPWCGWRDGAGEPSPCAWP